MPDAERGLTTKNLPEEYDYPAPDGSEIRLLSQADGGGLAHCTLLVKGVSKLVAHKTVEEIWYFISGRGEVWRKLDEMEAVTEVESGTSQVVPTGASFQFRNTGEEPLCFIIATIPRWPGAEEARPAEGRWKLS
jgi:mannose-6-phosphate isomerase-like protein (cupin superfamily)